MFIYVGHFLKLFSVKLVALLICYEPRAYNVKEGRLQPARIRLILFVLCKPRMGCKLPLKFWYDKLHFGRTFFSTGSYKN